MGDGYIYIYTSSMHCISGASLSEQHNYMQSLILNFHNHYMYRCVIGTAPGSMLFAGEYSLGMCLSVKHFLHWSEPFAWEMRKTLRKFSKQVPHRWNRVAAMAEWKALIFWWTAGWPNSGAEWSISLDAWYWTRSCSWCISLTGVVSCSASLSIKTS